MKVLNNILSTVIAYFVGLSIIMVPIVVYASPSRYEVLLEIKKHVLEVRGNTLYFQGPFDLNLTRDIKLLYKKSKFTTISMNSFGGRSEEGYKLSNFIHKNKITVEVKDFNLCYSSCAIAAMGSEQIDLCNGGIIGFHRPYIRNVIKQKMTRDDIINNTIVSTNISLYFFTNLGYSNAFFYIFSAHTNEDTFLTFFDINNLYKYKNKGLYDMDINKLREYDLPLMTAFTGISLIRNRVAIIPCYNIG